MRNGTGTRPFSTLGDQQLLDQTRRLAANQRSLEVHILDHLDEIDRRGLALRRGFSSLFDYAVRELRFTDAAAQRRIQTMRLCRRHGWVRAKLHSGELTLTAAAQLETAFAAAERQSRRASTNAGQECCPDRPGLPASPGAAGDREADVCGAGAGAGVATAAATTASAAHGAAAVDQEARCRRAIEGRADRHTGSDRGTRSPAESAAQSPRDPREREGRHTGSVRGRRLSDESAAVDAGPGAAGSQPVGRSDSGAATSGAAPAATPVGVPDRWNPNTATVYAPPRAGHALRTGLACDGPADTPVMPGASHAAAQHRGAGPADALPARLESGGAASHSPAPPRAPGPAAPSSDQLPAAPLRPPASRPAPAPLPVVAPSARRPTAALAPVPSRGDPTTQRSAGPVSAAPLLHPRRQRELIEQAAGMTTRQVAGLLADAAPAVVPPRDTLRAVAPDRFTLKVSIDRECEQGLRQLKNLLSHVDPRMSWGELVARLVREALARHDPGGGGRRRQRVGSTAASSRPAHTGTPGAVPAAAPAGSPGRDTPAPQGGNTAAKVEVRASMPPNAAPVRNSPLPAPPAGGPPAATAACAVAPGAVAPGTRAGGAAALAATVAPVVESYPTRSAPEPASATPEAAMAPEGRSAGVRVPRPAVRVPVTGAPRLSVPAGPAGGARQAGPSAAAAAAAAPKFARGGPAAGYDAAPSPPATSPPPQSTSGAAAAGPDAAPVSPGAPPAPELAGGVSPARGAGGAPGRASPQFTRDALRGPRRSPARRSIPAAVRRHVWLRDGGRCRFRDPLTGRRCNSSHLLQIHHLLPVAEGGGPEPENLVLSCFAHHRMCHGYGPAPAAEPGR